MPELAAAYAMGVVANLILLGIIVFRQLRKGESADNPIKGHIILGFLCAGLSWGGLIFFILIEASLGYLAKRKESSHS